MPIGDGILTDAALVEGSADVKGPAVLLAYDDGTLRDILALVQNPGVRAPGTLAIEGISARLCPRDPLSLKESAMSNVPGPTGV